MATGKARALGINHVVLEVGDLDEALEFYGSLFESEARHHTTYVRLARMFGSEDEIRSRLDELAAEEAKIIEAGEESPRMHS